MQAKIQKGKWPKPVESEPDLSPAPVTASSAISSEFSNKRNIEVRKTIGNRDLYGGLFESDDGNGDSLLSDVEPTFKR
jgi:hypothetical protein